MTPFRAPPDYARWPEVATLIHRAFAYMEPILGFAPAAATVSVERLIQGAEIGTAYVIEADTAPVACLFTRPSRDFPDALFLGALAVDETCRGRGLADALIEAAEQEAREKGYKALKLDTGRALTELHGFFRRHGFDDLPGDGEIITFRKALA